jgi:F-type H+-transporting ATPase subunit epsilon
MKKTIELDIVSAEASIFNGKVTFVSVTGTVGELGIHPGHSPLLTALKPGQIRAVLENGSEEVFYMSGGMLEVQPSMISILADTAFRADDLDEAAALTAKSRAEKILQQKVDGIEYSTALAELAEAAAQLRAISMLRDKIKRVH